MASTFSTSLKLELIGIGDQSGTWGITNNTNLGTLLEQAITGVQSITMVNANYTLTDLNGVSDEARNAVLVVGGTNSAIRSIIAPPVNKLYIVKNLTVGGFSIVIKTSTSTGVTILNGATMWVYCDGSEFYIVTQPSATAATGDTLVLRNSSGNFAAGTPTSITLTNGTGLPITTGVSGLGTGVATFLATPTSANLAAAVTNETGSGALVFATSPTLVTPALGIPSSITLTNAVGLPLSTGVTGTLPALNGGTGVTTSTGSGANVLSTSPTLVTPLLGTPTSGVLTSCTGLPLSTGVTGTLPVANGGTGVTTSTGSGSNVLSTSPTLVTPALGTPSALVGTNITGTASGLTAGAVTNGVYTTGNQTIAGNKLFSGFSAFGSANPYPTQWRSYYSAASINPAAVYDTQTSAGRAAAYLTGFANAPMCEFYYGNTTSYTTVGNISTDGTTTAYNTTSDYRLKESVVGMSGALSKVSQLRPVTYTWKSNGSAGQGFIAHELQAVFPDAVTGSKDEVNEDTTPRYQGIDTSFLIATLTAAIQEQQDLIDNLTSRLEILEAK